MEKLAKGNILVATRRFIDTEVEPQKAQEVYAQLEPGVRDRIKLVSRGDWVPRDLVSALWSGLHGVEKNDANALDLLHRCGRFIGQDATNTFLRLLVRLLTPSVFANKFPRIWQKDFDFGEVRTDLGPRSLMIEVDGISGFDYFAFTATGWFSHALATMGCREVKAEHEVSLLDPGPDTVQIQIAWS